MYHSLTKIYHISKITGMSYFQQRKKRIYSNSKKKKTLETLLEKDSSSNSLDPILQINCSELQCVVSQVLWFLCFWAVLFVMRESFGCREGSV